jgi:hypothetical protein
METIFRNLDLYNRIETINTNAAVKNAVQTLTTKRFVNIKPVIQKSVFDQLISNIECECNDLHGTIGFSAEHGNWSLSFNAEAENDFSIILEDFGFLCQDRWIQCEPSFDQLFKMQDVINDKVTQLQDEENQRIENESEESVDLYEQNGVSISNFI